MYQTDMNFKGKGVTDQAVRVGELAAWRNKKLSLFLENINKEDSIKKPPPEVLTDLCNVFHIYCHEGH